MNSIETAEILANQTWQSCRYETYLYASCMELEPPSANLKIGRDIGDRDDWQQHFVRGLFSSKSADFESFSSQTPLRCTLLMQAFMALLNELCEEETGELLSKEQIDFLNKLQLFVQTHVHKNAWAEILETIRNVATDSMPRYCSRLVLHLVPEELIADRFDGIREVDLGEEIFCSKIMSRLRIFPNLEVLHLDGSDITDDDSEVLSSLINLRHLDLSRTGCGNFALQPLLSCKHLRELNIQACSMDDGITYFLAQMRQLKMLTVDRLSDAAQQQLERQLPDCRIVVVV